MYAYTKMLCTFDTKKMMTEKRAYAIHYFLKYKSHLLSAAIIDISRCRSQVIKNQKLWNSTPMFHSDAMVTIASITSLDLTGC